MQPTCLALNDLECSIHGGLQIPQQSCKRISFEGSAFNRAVCGSNGCVVASNRSHFLYFECRETQITFSVRTCNYHTNLHMHSCRKSIINHVLWKSHNEIWSIFQNPVILCIPDGPRKGGQVASPSLLLAPKPFQMAVKVGLQLHVIISSCFCEGAIQ
jgi:hypothetical protein